MSKQDAGYEMVLDFGIDAPDSSEAETTAFCLGFEFGNLYGYLRYNPSAVYDGWIHTRNVDRIKALCRKAGRECSVVTIDDGWSHIEVEALPK